MTLRERLHANLLDMADHDNNIEPTYLKSWPDPPKLGRWVTELKYARLNFCWTFGVDFGFHPIDKRWYFLLAFGPWSLELGGEYVRPIR